MSCCSTCNSCGCNNCGCNSCGCNNWWNWNRSGCSRWAQPILCNQAQFSNAGFEDGATLVIHKISLEPCGNQSCTPRTFNIRVTGPSYPCGEIFQLRAGNCLELDEPLVITGLEPGTYCIEEIFSCPHEFISTLTGPACGNCVVVGPGPAPTVCTICSRRRLCRLCHGFGCGCSACSVCG